ncbi:gamma-glutamylcyclotransferase family protein [Microbacterium sp. NPDC055357]
MDADQLLFSYGTLQRPDVQLDTVGRHLEDEPDVLPGYRLDYVEVQDRRVEDASQRRRQPMLRPTGDPLDKVVGRTMWLTESELDACDEYEASLYRRVAVVLASGRSAWAYVAN